MTGKCAWVEDVVDIDDNLDYTILNYDETVDDDDNNIQPMLIVYLFTWRFKAHLLETSVILWPQTPRYLIWYEYKLQG
jgi:hypothetical protein